MAFNGAGVFTRLYNFVADSLSDDRKIKAQRVDDELNGIAGGLSNTITRDGQSIVIAPIPFNNQRLTSLGPATMGTDAVNRDVGDERYVRKAEAETVTGTKTFSVGQVFGAGIRFLTAGLGDWKQRMIGGNRLQFCDGAETVEYLSFGADGTISTRQVGDLKSYVDAQREAAKGYGASQLETRGAQIAQYYAGQAVGDRATYQYVNDQVGGRVTWDQRAADINNLTAADNARVANMRWVYAGEFVDGGNPNIADAGYGTSMRAFLTINIGNPDHVCRNYFQRLQMYIPNAGWVNVGQ